MQPDAAQDLGSRRQIVQAGLFLVALALVLLVLGSCATQSRDAVNYLSILPESPAMAISVNFGEEKDGRDSALDLVQTFLPAGNAALFAGLEDAVGQGRITRLDLAALPDRSYLLMQGSFSVFEAEWFLKRELGLNKLSDKEAQLPDPEFVEALSSHKVRSLWVVPDSDAGIPGLRTAALLGPGLIFLGLEPQVFAGDLPHLPVSGSLSWSYLGTDNPYSSAFRMSMPSSFSTYGLKNMELAAEWTGQDLWLAQLVFTLDAEDENPESRQRGLGNALRLLFREAARKGSIELSPEELRSQLSLQSETLGGFPSVLVEGLPFRAGKMPGLLDEISSLQEGQ